MTIGCAIAGLQCRVIGVRVVDRKICNAPLLALLATMVVAGTWTGSRLLERVDERTFTWLYKGVLTLIALRLVASAAFS